MNIIESGCNLAKVQHYNGKSTNMPQQWNFISHCFSIEEFLYQAKGIQVAPQQLLLGEFPCVELSLAAGHSAILN